MPATAQNFCFEHWPNRSAKAITILVLQDTLGGGVHKADSQNQMHH
jgi:hypothetical protein